MKRIILILFALTLSFAASAQYADLTAGELKNRGAKILYEGEKLTLDETIAVFSDFNGIDRSGDYLAYRKGYRTGAGLMIGGASAVVVGSVTFFGSLIAALLVGLPLSIAGEEVPVSIDIAMYSGLAVGSLGAASMVAGIPTLCVYKKRLKNLTAEYNSKPSHSEVALGFGAAPSGTGFTLTF